MDFPGFVNYFPHFFDLSHALAIISIALGGALAIELPKLRKKTLLAFALRFLILCACTLLGSYLGYSLFSVGELGAYAALAIILGEILPSLIWILAVKRSWFSKIVKACVFLALGYLATEFGHRINMLMFGSGLDSSSLGANLIRALPYLLMFPPTGFVLSFFDLGRFKKIGILQFILGIIIFVSVVISAYLQSKIEADDTLENGLCFGILVLLTLTNVSSYVILYSVIKANEELLLKEAELKLNESGFLMLKLNEKSIHEASAMRHDLKNHLAFINQLLASGNFDEAKSYSASLSDKFLQDVKIVDCGNSTISAIMNLECSKANLAKAPLLYRIAVPEKLPFDDITLCALITNVVDNAIEAQAEIEEARRNIDFTLRYMGGILRLICKNPTLRTHVPLAGTSKKGQGHGYGTSILKKIAAEHGGEADFQIENGIFIADILLNGAEEENNS